jgi:hypothetical protein
MLAASVVSAGADSVSAGADSVGTLVPAGDPQALSIPTMSSIKRIFKKLPCFFICFSLSNGLFVTGINQAPINNSNKILQSPAINFPALFINYLAFFPNLRLGIENFGLFFAKISELMLNYQ